MESVSELLRAQYPYRGQVAAGWPSPAEEELGDTLSFQEWLIPHRDSSVLAQVTTPVLREEGVFPGDTIVLERGRTPQHNDLVIARIDVDTMVRKYVRFNDGYRLVPGPHEVDEAVQILGVVTAIIRKYR